MLQILFEDNHLIAVNKPAGMLVHGDETGDATLADFVKLYIKDRYNKPGDVFLGVIHRIDRPVSGVVVFARTSKGLTRMNKLFAERQLQKTYWAIVSGRPDPYEDKLVHYLQKDKQNNKVKVFSRQRYKDLKRCELDYSLISEVGDHSLLNVTPITGRSHQIRAQLSKIGHPIRGDRKYGSIHHQRNGMIHLHARQLEFEHPIRKEPVRIVANPPDEQIWNTFFEIFE